MVETMTHTAHVQIQKEVNIHVSQEMFDHTKSDATASTATLTNAAAAGIAQAESSSMSALAGPSQHDIEVKEAARIEQQRQAFFEKQIAAMKKADLKVRRQRATHADAAVTARVSPSVFVVVLSGRISASGACLRACV